MEPFLKARHACSGANRDNVGPDRNINVADGIVGIRAKGQDTGIGAIRRATGRRDDFRAQPIFHQGTRARGAIPVPAGAPYLADHIATGAPAIVAKVIVREKAAIAQHFALLANRGRGSGHDPKKKNGRKVTHGYPQKICAPQPRAYKTQALDLATVFESSSAAIARMTQKGSLRRRQIAP